MMQRSRNDASESIRTADIPLQPEVIQCMDVQSLGRYTCCSATVRKHAREAKAWQLLSNVQRPAEDAFFAAARDATAARRSQALRRRLADQFDRWRAAQPMSVDTPTTNTFADFTFFLRIDDDEGRIWEGDLAPTSQRLPQATEAITVVGFDMSEIWAALKERNRMMAFLATDPSDPDDWRGYLDSLRISLVAVREADQATVALGQFLLDDALGITDEASQEYLFHPKRFSNYRNMRLLETERSEFEAFVTLNLTHDATGGGGGTLDSLEVGVTMLTPAYHDGTKYYLAEDLSRPRVEFLFTYLAGHHHCAREGALATIKGWDRDD